MAIREEIAIEHKHASCIILIDQSAAKVLQAIDGQRRGSSRLSQQPDWYFYGNFSYFTTSTTMIGWVQGWPAARNEDVDHLNFTHSYKVRRLSVQWKQSHQLYPSELFRRDNCKSPPLFVYAPENITKYSLYCAVILQFSTKSLLNIYYCNQVFHFFFYQLKLTIKRPMWKHLNRTKLQSKDI